MKRLQDYYISVIFEHKNEIELYNIIKNQIQAKIKWEYYNLVH